MKRVIILYPSPTERKDCRFGYSLNMRYISNGLTLREIDNYIIDFSIYHYDESVLIQILANSTHLVIEIDSFPLKRSENIEQARYVITLVRKHYPNIVILAYGKYCTLTNKHIEGINITLSGEAEVMIPEIIDSDEQLCEGLLVCDPIKDLNTLPSLLQNDNEVPLNSLIEINRKRLSKSTLFETARGCPGICSFCQRHGWVNGFRSFSDDRVCSEFGKLVRNSYKNIWIVDENFSADLIRAKRLLQKFSIINSKNCKIAISSWTHIDKDFLLLAKQSGITIISFGIESANKEILSFYKKNIDLDAFKDLVTYADSIGLYTVGNFIIGAPFETESMMGETLEYALKTPFDECNFKILDYMRGSELYNQLPEDKQNLCTHYFACKENGLNDFCLADLKNHAKQCQKQFNMRHKLRVLDKIKRFGTPYDFEDRYIPQ